MLNRSYWKRSRGEQRDTTLGQRQRVKWWWPAWRNLGLCLLEDSQNMGNRCFFCLFSGFLMPKGQRVEDQCFWGDFVCNTNYKLYFCYWVNTDPVLFSCSFFSSVFYFIIIFLPCLRTVCFSNIKKTHSLDECWLKVLKVTFTFISVIYTFF